MALRFMIHVAAEIYAHHELYLDIKKVKAMRCMVINGVIVYLLNASSLPSILAPNKCKVNKSSMICAG